MPASEISFQHIASGGGWDGEQFNFGWGGGDGEQFKRKKKGSVKTTFG